MKLFLNCLQGVGLKAYVKFLDKSREPIVMMLFFLKVQTRIFQSSAQFSGIKVITKIS